MVAKINQYRREPLFLLASSAIEHPVSGVFDINDLDEPLPVIAESLNLNLVNPGGYWLAMD